METKSKISTTQLFALLICSRIAVTLTYSANNHRHIVGNADWMAGLLYIPIVLVLLLPVFLNYRHKKDFSVLDRAYIISPVMGKSLSIAYALFFAAVPVITVGRFNIFVTSTMQADVPSFFYPLIIVTVVFFASIKGIEPIARAGALSATLVGALILVIILALVQRFNFQNMISPFHNGISDVSSSVFVMISNSAEIVAFAVILPLVNGKVVRSGVSYAVISGLIISIIMAVITLSLGAYASYQKYPFYTASGIAQIGNLKRLNAAHSAVWLVGNFIKSSFFVYLSYHSLEKVIPLKYKKLTAGVICLLIFVAAVLFTLNTNTMRYLFKPEWMGISILLFGSLVPLTVYIFSKRLIA